MSRSGPHDNTVVVVGGGCSGLFVTAHLLRSALEPVDIVLIEPAERLGGLAYSTTDPRHLLNSPAREMSAFSDRPDDFVTWLADARWPATDTTAFAPRSVYREYLAGLPHRARAEAHRLSEVEWVRETVTAISIRDTERGPRAVVGLAHGGHLEAADVVLALGVPRGGLGLEAASLGRAYVADPWAEHALTDVAGEVLLVGTGLTMVDTALCLERSAAVRAIHARSRHGLAPIVHAPRALDPIRSLPRLLEVERLGSARELLRALREAAEKAELGYGSWQQVVNELRPEVPAVWARLSSSEKERVLRHLLRYWEVHRHRVAPEVGGWLANMRSRGLLDLAPGSLEAVDRRGGRLEVRLRHGETTEILHVDALVDCAGPARDYGRGSPLVQHLLASGLARRGPFGLGLDTDECGDLLDRAGTAQPLLHTIGWVRRSRLLETTAVAEIRAQSEALAQRLVGARR